ncbi:hypothetical protein Bca4012_029467 [Brassica carinata]
MDISKMRDKLEDKLLRVKTIYIDRSLVFGFSYSVMFLDLGKRHRSDFLCQRRRQLDSISLYCDMMQQDGDLLSRKLSR